MIVRRNKTAETNKKFPNSNFYLNEPDNFVVDETTEKGKALASKILSFAPYFDFVLDAEGNLIDVTAIQPPAPEPQGPSAEDRLKALEDAMAAQLLGGI